MNRNERALRRLAQAHGCTLERTNGGHWRLHHPDGGVVIAAFTPGDAGHLRVIRGCLRRAARRTAAITAKGMD